MHKRHVVAFAHIQVNCTKLRHTANLSCSTATDVHGIVCIALDDVLHMLEELLTSGEHAVMQNKAAVNFQTRSMMRSESAVSKRLRTLLRTASQEPRSWHNVGS